MALEKKLSLEEQCIEEAKALFNGEDIIRLSNDISTAIKIVSSITISALNSGGSETQIKGQIEDSSDFINSELKNNVGFDDLVKNFIHEKIAEFRRKNKGKTSDIIESGEKELEPENLEIIINIFFESFETHKGNILELLELLKNNPNNIGTINEMFEEIITSFNTDNIKFKEYEKYIDNHKLISLIKEVTNLLNKYKSLRDSILEKKVEKSNSINQIQEKTDIIKNLSGKLQNYLSTIKRQKTNLEGMINGLNPHILNTAIALHDSTNKWMIINKESIQKTIKAITEKLVEIELIGLNNDNENSLYDKDGGYLTDKIITDIGISINDIENYLVELKRKILLLKNGKDKISKQETEYDEELFNEREILLELINLFSGDYVNSVWGTIEHLYSWIDEITDSELSHIKKMTALESIEKPIDLGVLKNNPRATVLLNMLAEIKIQKYLMKFDAENFGKIINTIPHKCFIEVMTLLKQIVSKYIGSNNDKIKKDIFKEKCKIFINRLNKLMPEIIIAILDKKDLNSYIIEEVKKILNSLKIKNELYDDFINIALVYYKPVITYNNSSITNSSEIKLEIAKKELQHKLIKHNDREIATCEKFIKYLIINLPQKITPIIIGEIHKLNYDESKDNFTRSKENLQRLRPNNNLSMPNTPYDVLLLQNYNKINLGNKKAIINLDIIIDDLFRMFPLISNNQELKKILKPYIEIYCENKKEKAINEHTGTTNIFSEIKKKNNA